MEGSFHRLLQVIAHRESNGGGHAMDGRCETGARGSTCVLARTVVYSSGNESNGKIWTYNFMQSGRKADLQALYLECTPDVLDFVVSKLQWVVVDRRRY